MHYSMRTLVDINLFHYSITIIMAWEFGVSSIKVALLEAFWSRGGLAQPCHHCKKSHTSCKRFVPKVVGVARKGLTWAESGSVKPVAFRVSIALPKDITTEDNHPIPVKLGGGGEGADNINHRVSIPLPKDPIPGNAIIPFPDETEIRQNQ